MAKTNLDLLYSEWVWQAAQAALDAHPLAQEVKELTAALKKAGLPNDESYVALQTTLAAQRQRSSEHEELFKEAIEIVDMGQAVRWLLVVNPHAVGITNLAEAKSAFIACREWIEGAEWITFTSTREVQIKGDFKP